MHPNLIENSYHRKPSHIFEGAPPHSKLKVKTETCSIILFSETIYYIVTCFIIRISQPHDKHCEGAYIHLDYKAGMRIVSTVLDCFLI